MSSDHPWKAAAWAAVPGAASASLEGEWTCPRCA